MQTCCNLTLATLYSIYHREKDGGLYTFYHDPDSVKRIFGVQIIIAQPPFFWYGVLFHTWKKKYGLL